MFGQRHATATRGRDEGEKPFWISFADLMTALMVLFLLVMSVALLAVTRTISERERLESQRQDAIEQLLGRIEKAADAASPRFSNCRPAPSSQCVTLSEISCCHTI